MITKCFSVYGISGIQFLASISRRTSLNCSSAQSICARVIVSGGANRTTVWCVSFDRMPLSISFSHTARAEFLGIKINADPKLSAYPRDQGAIDARSCCIM